MKLTTREKFISAICAALVSLYAVVNGVIKPINQMSTGLDSKIIGEQRRLNKTVALIKKAEGLDDLYKDYVKAFQLTVPDAQAQSTIIETIETAAQKAALHISDLKPRLVRQQNGLKIFSISLSADSPLEKITGFLDLLQRPPNYFVIDKLDLTRQTTRGKTELRANLTVARVYF